MERNRHISAKILSLTALVLLLVAQAFAADQDPPSRVARLTQIGGQVSIQPAGVDQWTQASLNYPMTTGDRLYVDQDGRAELQAEQTVVHVWHYTDLSVTNLTDNVTQLGLSQGSLHVRTFGLDANHTVEVDTPNGAITVMQPGDFRVDAYTGDGGTVVTVNSGEIQISGPSLSQILGSGQSVRLMGTNPIAATPLALPGKDPFDVWSQQRDRQLLSSQTRQYVNPDTIGSDDLDQYGTWNQTPDYGPIWYPTSVPVGWVPYTTGRWVWVSPWGWTWVDTYPWGFAPFHYGRWAYYGSRWGWVPGPYAVAPIYSPALVGFVGGPGFSVGVGVGGGFGLSAWFPLGPGEPFYPWYHCSPRYFTQVNITNINRVTIDRNNYYNYYHNKTTFNNIHYANRNIATVAVHANDFSSGRAITPRTIIRPTSQQLAHAQIIPHPFVMPTTRSIVPHPVTSIPVAAQRPTLITPRGEQRAVLGARTSAVPYRVLPVQPTKTPQSQGNINSGPQQPKQTFSRPLITHTEPPAPRPTFAQRQPALSRDPGRPLGPRQVNNLSQGRPAGPARTPEFPPHPSWAPKAGGSAPLGGAPRR